jgi:hypothetical protein
MSPVTTQKKATASQLPFFMGRFYGDQIKG